MTIKPNNYLLRRLASAAAFRRSVSSCGDRPAKVHPPDGEHENWWQRLNKAFGTRSSDFTNACMFQIQAAARTPFGGISELATNAALAMIEAAAPKDEIEGALAVQMACTHTAAMAVLAKLDSAHRSGKLRLLARRRLVC